MNPGNRNGTERKGKISARQERLAALLAAGQTDVAACHEAGVGVTTLWRWRKNPFFQERVTALQQQLVDRAIARLSDLMAGKALDVLTCRLDARNAEGESKATLDDVKAAFELFVNLNAAASFKERLEALEGKAK